MNEQNESQKQESGACGPGCACNAARPAGKARRIVGAIVLVAAGVLVARAVVKNNGSPAAPASTGYAALTAPAAASSAADAVKEIAALAELNTLATNADGVFVYVPGKGEAAGKAPTAQMQTAAKTIGAQGTKIGLFALKSGSPDYEAITKQMPIPAVLAMVKGRGTKAVSGEITETQLVQAFVAASSAGGCGPASAGCGPASAGCK